MTQRHPQRKPSTNTIVEHHASRPRHDRTKTLREHLRHDRTEPQSAAKTHPAHSSLTSLIERDAPLQSNTGLVLMYGPFQAEMVPHEGQGVASWLRECVHKHGIPSLVRFDYRRRAQVFRRDQFQSWLEPLLVKVPG